MLLTKELYKTFGSLVLDEHTKNIYGLAECNSSYSKEKINKLKLQIDLFKFGYLVVNSLSTNVEDITYTTPILQNLGFEISDGTNKDYINTGETLTFENEEGVNVEVSNNKVSFSLREKIEDFENLSSGNTITLTKNIVRIYNVYRNGIEQFEGTNNDYTISGNIITFFESFSSSPGSTSTESVKVIYVY